MTKEELLLVVKNPELTKLLLTVLTQDDTNPIKNESLEKAILGDDTTNIYGDNKPIVPNINDIREMGYQAPSKFVKQYLFPVGQKFQVWWTGSDSAIRNAFYKMGILISQDTLLTGKKYSITIIGEKPAKKKSA
jgi:hypothetical protein